ncbi:hypothetical protein V2J09_013970, partial [Rumex salicifolius]
GSSISVIASSTVLIVTVIFEFRSAFFAEFAQGFDCCGLRVQFDSLKGSDERNSLSSLFHSPLQTLAHPATSSQTKLPWLSHPEAQIIHQFPRRDRSQFTSDCRRCQSTHRCEGKRSLSRVKFRGMGRAGKLRAREQREKRLQEISLLRTIPYSDHQRWWNLGTIAVVTGSNRGIGFEIARQLASHGVSVILTARDSKTGLEAAKLLQEANLNVPFHQLDITDHVSVKNFAQWIQDTYGGIDILVNNAGVNFNLGSDNSVELAEQVITTNYFGTKNMTEAMIPLMKPSPCGARIVNVSSRLGRLNGRRNRIGDVTLREELSNTDTLKEVHIDNAVNSFIEQVKNGNWESGGWPQTFTDYSVSKLAVNCYTRMVARKLSNRHEGERIYINCYCPGWVKTAMNGWAGNISAEEAADTGVWLALLPTLPTNGNFFAERREINF